MTVDQSQRIAKQILEPSTALEAPFNADAEAALLGALLVRPEFYVNVAWFIQTSDFYILSHRYIWDAIADLHERTSDIDMITVSDELQKRGKLAEIGGDATLTGLVNIAPDSYHADSYARIVKTAAVERHGLSVLDKCKFLLLEKQTSLTEKLPRIQAMWLEVMATLPNETTSHVSDVSKEYRDFMLNPNRVKPAVYSYLNELDEIIGGWTVGLHIAAGDTGMGKSIFCQNVALVNAEHGIPIGIMSTEMTKRELIARFVQMRSGVSERMIRERRASNDQLETALEALGKVEKLPLYIDRDPRKIMTPLHIKAKATEMVGMGAKMIIVDHIHDMQMPDNHPTRKLGREPELATIAQMLKDIADELNVPILVAAQLNREYLKHQDKRPTRHNIRDCARIAHLAKTVTIVHRMALIDEMTEFPNQADLIVDKIRDGGSGGTARAYFDKVMITFLNGCTRRVDIGDL